MKKPMPPCKECTTDRHPGCHDKCEKFQEYRKALDERNQTISAQKNEHAELWAFKVASIARQNKKHKK